MITQAQIEAAKREWYYKTRSGGTTDEAWSAALTAAAEVGKHKVVFQSMPDGSTAVLETAAAEVGGIDALTIAKIAAKEKEKRDLAVAEMKECCARVAEWEGYATVGRQIAAEIRALKDQDVK